MSARWVIFRKLGKNAQAHFTSFVKKKKKKKKLKVTNVEPKLLICLAAKRCYHHGNNRILHMGKDVQGEITKAFFTVLVSSFPFSLYQVAAKEICRSHTSHDAKENIYIEGHHD
ncbi:hypothetical protein POVWA2_081730 [Plasmodium ovale wallikeri]|uniref:Uncharacterized protein n=1 Tax=Plasmodium ovale wallikeri TaxID=864142 RepID=A0A1A8ZNR7_PLAOA|nr:hypothetical protein POVWA1_052040 [Plasmodium ovale wallikeri]SBT57816.1 hypothetical protein POVWA2_081730 [Plasmodium ovale wallikeri]